MHSLLHVMATVFLLCALSACAGKTDERLERLEAGARDQHILGLRVDHLEERMSHAEGALGEVRDQVAASAARRRHISPPTERLPASPVVLGTVSTGPLPPVESLAYLPSADPKDAAPLPPPAVGVGAAPVNDPFAGPGLTTTPSGSGREGGARPVPVVVSPTPGKEGGARSRPVSPKRSSSGPAAAGTGFPAYDAAYAMYEKGEYAASQRAFADFLAASPKSSLAPNTLYWQGECLYSLGRYDDAILFFQDVINKYPKHAKAAAALLKAGHSYERLNDIENARFYWKILVEDFPGSAPAALARKRLNG